MKYHIIYIPGLGDKYDLFRRLSLFLWKAHGVSTELIAMKWNDKESFETKKQRVDSAIEKALGKNRRVVLVGESAGGSMALNVMSSQPGIYRMASLCGVNSPSTPLAPYLLARRPAFAESVQKLNSSRKVLLADRAADIVNITAKSDASVPVKRNLIPGSTHHVMPSHGHLTTIALCLTIYSARVVRILKGDAHEPV